MASRNASIARTTPLALSPDALRPYHGAPSQISPLGSVIPPRSNSTVVASEESDVEGMHHDTADPIYRNSGSTESTKVDTAQASMARSGPLRKKDSIRQRGLGTGAARRSLRAGSIKGMGEGGEDADYNSVFYTPIPTTGNPTEVLANRFQAWRKLLKDLIGYFREIQASYETKSKAFMKISNVINNTSTPTIFLSEGGLDDATSILRGYHKHAQSEAQKARDIENEVIAQLSGLRADLQQKIKEINKLSGDFKNSADKEKEGTRRMVNALQDALASAETQSMTGGAKSDPFILRLNVDRQVERQLEEENYLHRAYLNLEGSGRELESIVVGEIQKAYNALASILKREADSALETVDSLRTGPIAMPKDHEWDRFVLNDPHFVNPNLPVRDVNRIQYPGKFNPTASEIRAGMLERKSKYLKSYTPGWYVLSATHLHEFKSPDNIHTQTPVMSLYLMDQKLGSHSQPGSGSNKFSLKGKQAGAMHRGHSWVFRAETHDTMLAWYEDIRNLTEKTGAERSAFIRKNARSASQMSHKAMSMSSDGLHDDEADTVPYATAMPVPVISQLSPPRPQPGGRFPSDVDVNRGLRAPVVASREPSLRNASVIGPATSKSNTYPADVSAPTSVGNPASRPVTPLNGPSEAPNGQVRQIFQPYGEALTVPQGERRASEHRSVSDPIRQTSSLPRIVQYNHNPQELPLSRTPPFHYSNSVLDGRSNGTSRQESRKGSWAAGSTTAILPVGSAAALPASRRPENSLNGQLAEATVYAPVPLVSQGPYVPGRVSKGFFSGEPTFSSSGTDNVVEQTTWESDGHGASEAYLGRNSSSSQRSGSDYGDVTRRTQEALRAASGVPTTAEAEVAAEHLHQTGNAFPSLLRQDTDMTVTQLHIPGGFPGAGAKRIFPAESSA